METRNKLPIDWYKISSTRVYWTRQLFCWFLLSSTKLSWGNALDSYSWYFFSIMTGRSLVTKTCLQATWTMKEDQIFVWVLSNLPCESTRHKSICHVVSLPETTKNRFVQIYVPSILRFLVSARRWQQAMKPTAKTSTIVKEGGSGVGLEKLDAWGLP